MTAKVVRAAWKLFQEHVAKGLPVSAVVYSHSHADHWGGVRGIVNEADLKSGVNGRFKTSHGWTLQNQPEMVGVCTLFFVRSPGQP